MPALHNKYPHLKLYLVGSNPVKKIKMLKNSFIDVRPDVPDVREYMAKAEMLVVPLRIGGGMRIKILEALAMKKAVVSTSVGCEGIDVKHGEDLLVADSEDGLVKGISVLIENRNYRTKLGIQGCQTVQEKYSWESIAELIENNYAEVISESQTINRVS
jgi:glycosyltransferase involved in cell wall biosynthesis